MENKQKNREWVKTAVIIFLVIMLVLTFFSNTIQNYTLTEVSTEQVKAGTIAERVRCTGKVISMGNTEVKAEGTRTIAGVKVKIGQEVNEGDILFVMGSAATDEVETATDARDTAYYAYKKAQVSYPADSSGSAYNAAYQAYLRALDAEQNAWAMYSAVAAYESNPEYQAALAEYTFAEQQEVSSKAALAEHQATLEVMKNSAEQYYYVKYAEFEAAPAEEKEYLLAEVNKAYADFNLATADYNASFYAGDPYYDAVTSAQSTKNTLKAKLDSFKSDVTPYKERYDAAASALKSAESALSSAQSSYASSQASLGTQYATAAINEEEAENTLNKKQAKLDYLTGEGVDVNIYAPVSGKIQSIGKSAGSKVVKDDVLCVIEVPDQGYTMEASVTAEQAKRLKVGDESVKSMYGGDSVDGTIISIRPDPKDPQNKRIIEFDLTGKTDNLENGKEITLTVGQKSVSYDLVVPKSAILSDTNGKFVLKIESKSSALGNRYFARRVDVQEIASDDSSCAVTGDLQQNSDHVITNSSAPVKAGNQIRLSDAS